MGAPSVHRIPQHTSLGCRQLTPEAGLSVRLFWSATIRNILPLEDLWPNTNLETLCLNLESTP